MTRFREFFQQNASEEEKDITRTLNKIPDSHAALVKGFKWRFHGGNTLNGDDEHVGYMDDEDREIAVAAPWNYGREFTILHEIGHKVWERLPQQLQNKWKQICAATKRSSKALQQDEEELFCMAYGSAYTKHPPITYCKPGWLQFIKNLPQ